MSEAKTMHPKTMSAPAETPWEDINEPGAYVEVGSGELYRIPSEALLRGASPMIAKVSINSSRFVRVSTNPFITLLEARKLASNHNIEPNF